MARAAGAEIGPPVARVGVRNGRAVGVELEDGTRIGARAVISGAHPRPLTSTWWGEEHLPPEVVRDIRRYRTRSGSVKVNLALGELTVPTAWAGPVPGDPPPASSPSPRRWSTWSGPGTGPSTVGCPPSPYIEAVFPAVFQPDLAPEAKHLALYFTQFGAYELRGRTWETCYCFFPDFPVPFRGWPFGFSPGAGPFGGGESSETSLSPAGYPPFVATRLRPDFTACTSPNGSEAPISREAS